MAGRWRDTTPEELAGWLGDIDVPWWFAGGWALDLWLGETTRVHSDIEIGCFRDELPKVLDHLGDWEVAIARNKVLVPYDRDQPPPEPPFSLWIRRHGAELWDFEMLVEERSSDRWLYRRDARISLPLADLVLTSADRRRVIAPEVQLLYKSKALRPKDEADFSRFLPHLEDRRRRWLLDALGTIDPSHPWIARLAD